MRIIGCDLHARQQTLAMLDTLTGEVVTRTLMHAGNEVREFYAALPRPVVVGIEAIGPMQWFLDLLEELQIECQIGDATKIRAAEPRKQKYDRRDAELILKLLAEKRFPAIWRPSKELLDLRALLLHRHHWVRLRTQVQNALQAIALAHGLRRGPGLWSYDGQAKIAFLPLPPHTAYRRCPLQAMYRSMAEEIKKLTEQVAEQAGQHGGARFAPEPSRSGTGHRPSAEVFLGDPRRFADGKALASYVGLIPQERSSGRRRRLGKVSKQGSPLLRFLWGEAGAHAARRDPELQRFYRRKLVQKGLGKARVAVARKLGIRLWIMLRDHIDYQEFCRRGQKQSGAACAGMPGNALGAKLSPAD